MQYSLCLLLLPLSSALSVPRAAEPHSERSAKSVKCQSVDDVVAELDLQPSTEKGYFIETFKDPATVPGTNRSFSTAIYYLLDGAAGYSLWHKLDAAEVWHYYAGAPLSLYLSRDDGSCVEEHVMGNDFSHGQRPQVLVDQNEWQRARSHGEWTLVGTTGENFILPSSSSKGRFTDFEDSSCSGV